MAYLLNKPLKMVAIIALPRSPLINFLGIPLIILQLFHDRNRLPNKGYQFILMVMKKPISQEALVDIDRVPAASSFARHQRLSQQLRSAGRAHSAIDAMQRLGLGDGSGVTSDTSGVVLDSRMIFHI